MSGTVVAVPMMVAPYELIFKAVGNGNISTADVGLIYNQELQNNDTASSSAVYTDIACSTTTEPREHLFDKAVTPSDVGKLNRLVIPKQHAEKYFALNDGSGRDKTKGVLLNFEDTSHKTWRFCYSYWSSSQSYVLTKGWSHYVKEKCLQAGDIVTFQRSCRSRCLFISFRRRPSYLLPSAASPPPLKRCPKAVKPLNAPLPLDIDSVGHSSIPCVGRRNPFIFLSALKSASDDGQPSPFQVGDLQRPSLSNNCNSYSSSVRLFGVNLQLSPLNLCAGITVEEEAKMGGSVDGGIGRFDDSFYGDGL